MFIDHLRTGPTGFRAAMDTPQVEVLLDSFTEQRRNRMLAGFTPYRYDEWVIRQVTHLAPLILWGSFGRLDYIEQTLRFYGERTNDEAGDAERIGLSGGFGDLGAQRRLLGNRALVMADDIVAAKLAIDSGLHEQLEDFLAAQAA